MEKDSPWRIYWKLSVNEFTLADEVKLLKMLYTTEIYRLFSVPALDVVAYLKTDGFD